MGFPPRFTHYKTDKVVIQCWQEGICIPDKLLMWLKQWDPDVSSVHFRCNQNVSAVRAVLKCLLYGIIKFIFKMYYRTPAQQMAMYLSLRLVWYPPIPRGAGCGHEPLWLFCFRLVDAVQSDTSKVRHRQDQIVRRGAAARLAESGQKRLTNNLLTCEVHWWDPYINLWVMLSCCKRTFSTINISFSNCAQNILEIYYKPTRS